VVVSPTNELDSLEIPEEERYAECGGFTRSGEESP
jgi:hypothetical protein